MWEFQPLEISKYMKKIFFLTICIASLNLGYAQVVQPSINKAKESEFVFEVKTIDEFIERFNNDQYTLIRQFLEKSGNKKKLTRVDLVKTLFNYQDPVWDKDVAGQFIQEVCDTSKEKFLDFYSDEWYALAECQVRYKGTSRRVFITLQVMISDRTGAAKWVICGARAPFLDFSRKVDPRKFLNPISHATDFIGLKKAMEDKQFVRNYLSDKFKESHLNKFLAEISSGDIQFEQINSVSYHFLNLENWLFTVKEYIRPGKNSGWLIQSLSRRTKAEKDDYLRNVLYCD
jgi:hypothetical protein